MTLESKARAAAQTLCRLYNGAGRPALEDCATEVILSFANFAVEGERERYRAATVGHLRKRGDDAMESGYAEASFAYQSAANIVDELASLLPAAHKEGEG